jgi:Domain of unknown function (DUF4190)/Domain of unknown function (DUF1707)
VTAIRAYTYCEDYVTPSDQPNPDLRAADADREAAAERLQQAAVEGRLDHEELEQRLAEAYNARWTSDLARLTADVTPAPPPPAPVYPYPPPYEPPRYSTNGLAVGSLVAALLWFFWIGSVAAIVFGHVALSQIKNSEGRQTGTGMAVAGLVMGYLQILGLVAWAAAI